MVEFSRQPRDCARDRQAAGSRQISDFGLWIADFKKEKKEGRSALRVIWLRRH